MKKYPGLFLVLLVGLQMSASAQTFTFTCPTTATTWAVPAGVTSITVDMWGGKGGANSNGITGPPFCIDSGGHGARVQARLAVTPGQVLNINVGGAGSVGIPYDTAFGGFNGGGDGYYGVTAGITPGICGGGGGGASDIRMGGTALTDRVLVAGGGGGAGGNYCWTAAWSISAIWNYDRGGDGGTITGENGFAGNVSGGPGAGLGGSAVAGGTGGASLGTGLGAGASGALGVGGVAGTRSAGGGGGGGYYGGGGSCYSGGGGGSSFTHPTLATLVTHTRGYNAAGCGYVIICAPDPGTILGPNSLCVASTGTYTNPSAPTGGTWSTSSTAIATIDPVTGVATGTGTGIVTFTYSSLGTCGNAYAVKTVTVNPDPPAITGVTSTCTGSTTVLSNATSGGVWSSSNPGVADIGSSSGIVTGISVGSATITYRVTTGCFSTITVTIVGISGSNQGCVGAPTPLTATSPGGTWTSSDVSIATVGASSGIVTGVTIGTATITYTLGSGCISTWPMTINPLAPVLGRDSVCVGSSIYLTDIVGGGTWSSSYPGVATVTFDSGKVTGLAAGITTISYGLSSGCFSTRSIKVIGNPGAISGIMQVCPDATTSLSNTTGGGTWTSGNTGIATVSPGAGGTGVVSGVSAGTVEVTYTIPPGCLVSASVIVHPLPDPITGNDVLCPGAKDTVYNATPGGLWSSGTLPVITIIDINGAITAVGQGVSMIKYTLATGCFRTKAISVNPLPVPNIFYNFNTGTFEASPGYAHYQWYDSIQGKIPFATSRTLAALNTEYYYVEVTDGNGCKGKSAKYYFDVKQLGINNVSQGRIRIYPNPSSSTVFIESSVKVSAMISSIDGKLLIAQEDAKEIDISNLASGIYMIALYNEEGIKLTVARLVKD